MTDSVFLDASAESDEAAASDRPSAVVPDRADAPVSEVTERFLRAIIAKVPLERIEELHLFAPLRQGGVETGIAVVAARVPETATEADAEDVSVAAESVDGVSFDDVSVEDASADDESVAVEDIALPSSPLVRHTVYTARYRLVLKGPERGKWEADVVDEADAPLVTVEMVVRGVQRRAGEEAEILRYSDRQIARALRMPWPPAMVPDIA